MKLLIQYVARYHSNNGMWPRYEVEEAVGILNYIPCSASQVTDGPHGSTGGVEIIR